MASSSPMPWEDMKYVQSSRVSPAIGQPDLCAPSGTDAKVMDEDDNTMDRSSKSFQVRCMARIFKWSGQ